MTDLECDSVLVYGTDIPSKTDDINQDLKRIIHHIRIRLVKQSQIVSSVLLKHIVAGYMISDDPNLETRKRKIESANDEEDEKNELLEQVNLFLAHSFNCTVKMGHCQTNPDDFAEDSITLYLTYELPHRFSLSKLQKIDTSQYKTICRLLGIKSQLDGPELFCLISYASCTRLWA